MSDQERTDERQTKAPVDIHDVLALVGLISLAVGVSLLSVPAALIVVGVILLVLGVVGAVR